MNENHNIHPTGDTMNDTQYIRENDIVHNPKKCDVCGRKPWNIYYRNGFMRTFYTCGSCKLDEKRIARSDWMWFTIFLFLCAILISLFTHIVTS
jgi:hypothetical protein